MASREQGRFEAAGRFEVACSTAGQSCLHLRCIGGWLDALAPDILQAQLAAPGRGAVEVAGHHKFWQGGFGASLGPQLFLVVGAASGPGNVDGQQVSTRRALAGPSVCFPCCWQRNRCNNASAPRLLRIGPWSPAPPGQHQQVWLAASASCWACCISRGHGCRCSGCVPGLLDSWPCRHCPNRTPDRLALPGPVVGILGGRNDKACRCALHGGMPPALKTPALAGCHVQGSAAVQLALSPPCAVYLAC